MTHTANGCTFIAKDDMIVAHIRGGNGDFEPETTEWLFSVLGSGDYFVDVGASTGWFSVPLAERGVEVVAFEPNAKPFARLLENAALNGVTIDARSEAVTDESGEVTLYFNAKLPLTSGGSLNRADCLHPTGESSVKAVRLDDVLSKAPKVIKIDVEGHEMSVLRGAGKTILKHRPLLVLEANTEGHVADLGGWLTDHDYEWRQADTRNLLCTPKS